MPLLQSLGKPSGLQAGINPPKDRRERAMREGERETEDSTKGKGGLYNMQQYPTLPPKWPRSGVTFHFIILRLVTVSHL